MSDIVDPPTVQVNGITYRVRHNTDNQSPSKRPRPASRSQQAPAVVPAPAVAETQQSCPVEVLPAAELEHVQQGDDYIAKVYIDEQLFPFLIGQQGQKRKDIEQTTGATLDIPRLEPGSSRPSKSTNPTAPIARSHPITITAPDLSSLQQAHSRVQQTIQDALNGRYLDFTHFVSIPLQSAMAVAELTKLKEQLLSQQAPVPGLDASIFPSPATLHLTLVMLKLYSDELRHRAVETLRGLAPVLQELLGGEPLSLHVAGLHSFSPDPSSSHVVYLGAQEVVPVGREERLGLLVGAVVAAFKRAGLWTQGPQYEVKLHATIINTSNRKQPAHSAAAAPEAAQGGRAAPFPARVAVDATSILQRYADFDVGVMEVPALHISIRGEYGEDGYYKSLVQVPLMSG